MLADGKEYEVILGDCIEHMSLMPAESIDLMVTSVPFPSMFSYTSESGDLGNSEDLQHETKIHFSFWFRQLIRVIKPGRVAVIHAMQIPRMKRIGGVGMFDFRGFLIRLGERAGLVWEYDWIVRKNPQAQAIRTRSRELQFIGLEKDRAKSRGAMGDYLLKFRAPGENKITVDSECSVSRNEWIDWAECCWNNIKETDTLNVRGTKGENDTRHICPMGLPVIERLVRLFTNPGEIVFDPFTGIGSSGVVAVKHGRRFYGCELKPEYHAAALANIQSAINAREADKQQDLFASVELEPVEAES